MTLRDAINQYIAWRQVHGAKYKSGSAILHLFLKSVDGETNCNAVTTAQVLSFLAGKGPLTRYRENKHGALAGFYRYAISRGYVTRSPLPDNEPKPPSSAPPHIYSRDELRRLFDFDAHGGQSAERSSTGRRYIPHTARSFVWIRLAYRRGDAPHSGGC